MEEGPPFDWPLFLTSLQDIAFGRKRPSRSMTPATDSLLAALVSNREQLVDFLDNAFSPVRNGFRIIELSRGLDTIDKADYPDNEIWLSDPCLFIEEGLFAGMPV